MRSESIEGLDSKLESLLVHRMIVIAIVASTITGTLDSVMIDQLGIDNYIDLAMTSILIIAFYLHRIGWWVRAGVIAVVILTLSMALKLYIVQYHRPGTIAVFFILSLFNSFVFPKKTRLILHLFTVLLFALVLSYLTIYGKSLPDGRHLLSTSLNVIIIYILITFCTRMVKSRYDSLIENITRQNVVLNRARKRIERQQEELSSSNEALTKLNSSLEQLLDRKSQKIAIQKEALYSHAFSLSHVIRAPLAKILGFVYLKEIDDEIASEDILEQIASEAKTLDQLLHKVNDQLTSNNLSEEDENMDD